MISLLLVKQIVSKFSLSSSGAKNQWHSSILTTDNGTVAKSNNSYRQAVGIFSHHRDVKVALEELREVGFPLNKINLIARNYQKHDWNYGLEICDRPDFNLFKLPTFLIPVLQSYFNKGKYLAIVSGTQADIKMAGSILARRPKHAKVWHI
ncbi:hypothetical protein NIES4102_31860 [Chondrocystis sp. NIES-4102]|nr:hypothetical protein NIES4102_31860 [Chondrocystis sp. NIES-4102]